jgi:hypothetical protein
LAVSTPFCAGASIDNVDNGKEPISMCYNCGCGMPNNDMGKPQNITNKTIEEAAAAMGQNPKDAKKNARDLLEKVLAAKEESKDKNWRP